MNAVLFIALGGFFGAISRFSIGNLAKKYWKHHFPIGTLAVNLIGSFLLGFLIGKSVSDDIYSLFGIGFMGAFTTFSTMNLEAIQLMEKNKYVTSIAYLIVSYVGGFLLAILGFLFGRTLS
jgi:CrcB protein